MPATEWTRVVSRLSSTVIGGMIEGMRRASMVLSGARAANEQDVVPPGDCDFNGPAGVQLPLDFRKILRASEGVSGWCRRLAAMGPRFEPAVEMLDNFSQGSQSIHRHRIGQCGLGTVGLGHDQVGNPLVPSKTLRPTARPGPASCGRPGCEVLRCVNVSSISR